MDVFFLFLSYRLRRWLGGFCRYPRMAFYVYIIGILCVFFVLMLSVVESTRFCKELRTLDGDDLAW